MQPRPTKLTIKIKRETNDVNASIDSNTRCQIDGSGFISLGLQDGKIGEQNEICDSTFHGRQVSTLHRLAEVISSSEERGYSSEDEDDQYYDNAQNQLVVYEPSAVGSGEIQVVPDPIDYLCPPFPRYSFHHPTSRVLPSVGAFTVQCAICFKWRLIPSKEKYEEIREHILEQPFVCEAAREWRPEISCDDQPDIMQDGSRLWAIDKPNIAQPPLGWERLLRIRGEGGTKFADVYYVAPSGKRLRSMVEVQKYLLEHPDEAEGVAMSQFSFQIPRPLQVNYVRKRPARSALLDGSGMMGMPGDFEPSEEDPIAWVGPNKNTNLQLGGVEYCSPYEVPVFEPQNRPAKRSKTRSTKTYNGDYMYENHQEEGRRV